MEALSGETVHERAAVITECKLHVVVNLEPVRDIDLESRSASLLAAGLLESGALGDDHLVASLVDHTDTHLALVALLSKTPENIILLLQILVKHNTALLSICMYVRLRHDISTFLKYLIV